MTTTITVWSDSSEGTNLPDFSVDGVARWWTHIHPDRPPKYALGDFMHVRSSVAPPEFQDSRWRIVAIELAPEKYVAVFGPTLHLVTGERML